MSEDNRLMTAREAAVYLGVGHSKMTRFRQEGGGPKFVLPKVGKELRGRPRYRKVDLDAYLESLPGYETNNEADGVLVL